MASTTKGQQQQPAPPPASKPAPAAAQKQLSASAQQPVPDRQPPAEKPATAPVNRRDDNEEETIKLEYPSKSILNRSTRPMVAQTNAEVNGTAPPSRNRVIVSNFNFINFFINIINFINIGIKYCRIQYTSQKIQLSKTANGNCSSVFRSLKNLFNQVASRSLSLRAREKLRLRKHRIYFLVETLEQFSQRSCQSQWGLLHITCSELNITMNDK